jgi:hypothetical protein
MFGGDLEGGGWEGTHLGEKGQGLRLAENEFHKILLSKEDVVCAGPDKDSTYLNLWFEDSLGRRHIVSQSRRHLAEMKKT